MAAPGNGLVADEILQEASHSALEDWFEQGSSRTEQASALKPVRHVNVAVRNRERGTNAYREWKVREFQAQTPSFRVPFGDFLADERIPLQVALALHPDLPGGG